jgi:rhodanese-related sulfurtransferase
VNPRRSWASARIDGALNLDHAGFDAVDLPEDEASMLVFYCFNFMCRKAPQAARRAVAMGYGRTYVMSAGIKGWLDADLPTESGEVPASSVIAHRSD